VVEAAINPNPDVPGFVNRFNVPFPVGTGDNTAALTYMQLSPLVRSFVPFMVFIDRKGEIRAQFTGGDPGFFDDQMDQHIREQIMKLLNEPAAAKPRPTRKKPG
jgi:hypothetical protein